jgi:hypothetical protein
VVVRLAGFHAVVNDDTLSLTRDTPDDWPSTHRHGTDALSCDLAVLVSLRSPQFALTLSPLHDPARNGCGCKRDAECHCDPPHSRLKSIIALR